MNVPHIRIVRNEEKERHVLAVSRGDEVWIAWPDDPETEHKLVGLINVNVESAVSVDAPTTVVITMYATTEIEWEQGR